MGARANTMAGEGVASAWRCKTVVVEGGTELSDKGPPPPAASVPPSDHRGAAQLWRLARGIVALLCARLPNTGGEGIMMSWAELPTD